MNTEITVLVVEDEEEPAEMLKNYLEMHEYQVLLAKDGDSAVGLINNYADSIDIAVLDIMIPGEDGYELCRRIRNHSMLSDIPVIFLTAKDEEQDEIKGLDTGADSYVAKPVSLNLIKAHIESQLRRHMPDREREGWISYGNVSISPVTMEVLNTGKKVELTQTEFNILKLFFENPKLVYSRQQILEHISPEEKFIFDRTIDVHIKNLRIKLNDNGELIKTYRGAGYGLNKDIISN